MAETLNREDDLYQLSMAAPFPPAALMYRVSGLTNETDFAQHGRDFFRALSQVSPKPLLDFQSILEFGIGSGRFARMFKDYRGRYYGADIDHELLDWTAGALPWVTAVPTIPRQPLPCPSGQIDCVFAISVYSHMNEHDTDFYLREMYRVTCPGAWLFLTIHGRHALNRALTEPPILTMLDIPQESVAASAAKLAGKGFSFVRQESHLTSDSYDYGMTFISDAYVRSNWSKLFSVEDIAVGGIHDFQDIVVLKR